jgi:A/G-specific adenine glycosylase
MAPPSTPQVRKLFIRKLLAWYRRSARDLPWRATRNPYAILVSEFMLQQTQVSRVLEYFPRFMARFPTIGTLARARPKAVREEWDGLGYYARARNLHALARVVSKTQRGRLSDKPEELQQLPGVGRYTAGAVACFAYERPVPAVDTNVARVIRRVFLKRETRNGKRETWKLAAALIPKNGKRAWRFNQALMELGALICKARSPLCPECPVKHNCSTFSRLGTQSPRAVPAAQRSRRA